VIDDTKYSQMQPVQVSITTSSFASPTTLGLGMLGIVMLPMSMRLVGPPVLRFTRKLTSRIKLPGSWSFRRKAQRH
jgi:hypothetical protein